MTDTPVWSKKYKVLSIGRLYLRSLEFTPKQIALLSDEDMQSIADIVTAQHFDHELVEDVRFLVACDMSEK